MDKKLPPVPVAVSWTDTSSLDGLEFGCGFFPLEISDPALPLFSFVGLFAHKYLYIRNALRLFKENMMIQRGRFNTYLFLALCLVFVGACQTDKTKGKKALSTIRLHLEVSPDGTNRSEPVPIYRASPVLVNVEKAPFVTEKFLDKATLIDAQEGFAIQIQFDRQGTWLLEQYSTANRGRHVAIQSQFTETRWLAAPVIEHRIANGLLTFTPDATREEAERIVLGLNNMAEQKKKSAQ